MQSVNDTLATAPGELDGAADGSDTSASDGEVSELFTREATGLYRVSRKTTLEKVLFHSGASSAAYFASSPHGVAHVLYLSVNAMKTF
ncbi:hypothetical protein I4F81_009746 [Pyropia yezoensis]|uniref:Uncharacterized protein n=1 Tax=Pyropia yezoensis TaxID=2788 RepID=A0ACC3CAQ5_PYRYE|nr:hypothetical protein I4F81_009746 [Neopyropia yezoensis]